MVKRKKSKKKVSKLAMRRRRKTVRKQSSSEMSTLASKIMKKLDRHGDIPEFWVVDSIDEIRIVDVKKLCASVLSQDETKGQRRR